jgi:hypothetical protein
MMQPVSKGFVKTGKQVAATMQTVIAAPIETVFDFVAAEDVLPRVLTGYGLLPRVVRTSGNTGPWDQPGSSRTVHLADGSTAREQLTDYEPPGYFAYRTSDYTFALKHLATSAAGQWWFEERQGQTHIRWTYTFMAKGPVSAMLLALFVKSQWAGYMSVCLENTRQHFVAHKSLSQ